MNNIYAIYKGDTFFFVGTKAECAVYLGVKEDTVYFYTTPIYRKRSKDSEYNNRLIVIILENEEENIYENRTM